MSNRYSRAGKKLTKQDVRRDIDPALLNFEDAKDAVNTIADLAAFDDSSLVGGELKFIHSVKDFWRLSRSAALTPDGITVLAAHSGVGQWIRLGISTPQLFLKQATWYIDGTAGNDENDGTTSGTALKSFQEFLRRIGPAPRVLPQTITVNILTSLPAGDRINLEGISGINFGVNLIIRGTPVAASSQLGHTTAAAVSAVTHAAADGAQKVTVTGQAWASFLNKRVQVVGGARDGMIFYPVKDLTGGQARTSPGVIVPPGQLGFISSGLGTPTTGDTLTVMALPVVPNPIFISDVTVGWIIEDLEFNDDADFTGPNIFTVNNNLSTFNRCIMHGTLFQDGMCFTSWNGCLLEGMVGSGGAFSLHACAIVGSQGVFGSSLIGHDTIFQGAPFEADEGGPTGMSELDDVAFYDVTGTTAAISSNLGGRVRLSGYFSGSHTIYGTSAGGYTLGARHGGTILYTDTTTIKLAGGTGIINWGGTAKILTDLPLLATGTNPNNILQDA
jgi:Fe-S-cluster formation regulator IscX/YfhJ